MFRCAVPGDYSTRNHLRAPLDQPVTPGLCHRASQTGCRDPEQGQRWAYANGRERRTEPTAQHENLKPGVEE